MHPILGVRDLPSLSDSGLTGAEMASPLRLWAPWGRVRVLSSVRTSRDRNCVVASLCVGEGAVGPAASPLAGGGVPLWPCPFRDMPEVSGDQDTLSWVQGAAQGVVTGGYLGRTVLGTARKLVCEAA